MLLNEYRLLFESTNVKQKKKKKRKRERKRRAARS
jgi:hypothetical protein